VNLAHLHNLSHPSQLHGALDDIFGSHRVVMIDLPVLFVDLEQREVVVIAVQRTKIYETDALLLLHLGLAAELQ
jgi:hypothetical protein